MAIIMSHFGVRQFIGIGIIAVLFFSVSIHTTSSQANIKIVATTTIVADAVSQVTGNLAEVTAIMPPGSDPHEYTPTPSNVETINNAQHVFFLGAEESLSYLLTNLENNGQATSLIEILNQTQLIGGSEGTDPHGHGAINPHFWMDVKLFEQAVVGINETLSQLYPNYVSIFSHNTASYLQQLEKLDSYIHSQVSKLSAAQRYLITQHASMAYFARAYNFTAATLQGISTEAQSSVQNINNLASFIVKHQIPVVFSEDSSDPNNLEAVLDSVRSQGQPAVMAGKLYVASVRYRGDTYIDMMTYNTDLITQSWLAPPQDTSVVLDNSLFSLFGLLGFGLGIVTKIRRKHQ